jgi:nucleotide-binding universal stress UspA family protein
LHLNILLGSDNLETASFSFFFSNPYLGQWESLKQEGRELLTLLTNKAIAQGVNAEHTQEFGDAGRMICEVARNWQADLIILGRRGLSGIKEFFLGSVSNYVLHHAHCSVLTVQGCQ